MNYRAVSGRSRDGVFLPVYWGPGGAEKVLTRLMLERDLCQYGHFLDMDECWSLVCCREMCPVWVEAGGSRCVNGVWIWGRMSRCGV